uniref:G-protein coupled receptors family 1 profile domain-containing protein n=1 Tax=Strongyloides stercoralis TaxID=6248 RepID=A0A0K0E7S0_STRER
MVFNLTYDDDVTIAQINENNNNVYIGLSYVVITSIFMFTQIMTFIAFYKNRSVLMINMPYIIISHLGLVDFIQQICHFISGFYVIFYYFPDSILSYGIAALLQCSYMTSVSFILLLSLNRLDVFFDFKIIPVFNKKKAFFFGIIICYIWAIALFIFYMFPSNRLEFISINYSWNYVGNKTLGFQLENKSVIIMLVISFICYLCVIGKIMHMRGLTSGGLVVTLSDIKILLQAMLNFFSITFLEVSWSNISGIITQAGISLMPISYLFIIISGGNTMMNILFIREVRSEITNFFTCYTKKNKDFKDIKVQRMILEKKNKHIFLKAKVLTE